MGRCLRRLRSSRHNRRLGRRGSGSGSGRGRRRRRGSASSTLALRGRSWCGLRGGLLLGLMWHLLRLDGSGLRLVLKMLLLLHGRGLLALLDVLGVLLLDVLLRLLLLLLLDVLRLDVLLRVLLRVRLVVRRVLGLRVLLLRRVLRDWHGRLNGARVLLLLVVLLGWGLLGMRAVRPVIDGVVAAIHIGLRLGILIMTVPVGISEGRLCWRLHRHRGLRRGPCRLLHEVSSLFLHLNRRERGANGGLRKLRRAALQKTQKYKKKTKGAHDGG